MPRILKILCITLPVICALYVVYWFVASSVIESQIRKGIARQQRPDRTVSISELKIDGFPLKFNVFLSGLTFNDQREGVTYSNQLPVKIKVPAWAPWNFEIKSGGEHNLVVEKGNSRSVLKFVGLVLVNGSVGFDQRLRQLDVNATNLRITEEKIGTVRIEEFLFTLVPDKSVNGARYSLTTGPISLPTSLDPGLGTVVDLVTVRGAISPYIPRKPDRKSLRRWAESSGKLELHSTVLDWGDVHVLGNGNVFFDDALQPEAQLDLTVKGHKIALNALAEKGVIPKNQAGIMRFALAAFTKPAEDGSSERHLFIPLSIKDGSPRLGPLKLPSMSMFRSLRD
jgi:hypothetical protein